MDHKARSDWLVVLRELANDAEAQIKASLFPSDNNKRMTQSALTCKEVATQIKSWEDASSDEYRLLPDNTPDDISKWFMGSEKISGRKRKTQEESK